MRAIEPIDPDSRCARLVLGLTAHAQGFSLHCGVRLHENDREGIGRLCRYGARALHGRP
jgi:hypothetical protein